VSAAARILRAARRRARGVARAGNGAARARRAAGVGVAALCAWLALLGAGAASAGAAPSLALPDLSLALPNVSVKLPEVKLPEVVKGVGVTVPEETITVPSVTVSVPEVTVSTPAVTVSTPAATVSTPSVSVSTPAVSSSQPTGSSTGGGEGSQGGSGSGSGSGGSGSGGSGSGSGGSGSSGSGSSGSGSGAGSSGSAGSTGSSGSAPGGAGTLTNGAVDGAAASTTPAATGARHARKASRRAKGAAKGKGKGKGAASAAAGGAPGAAGGGAALALSSDAGGSGGSGHGASASAGKSESPLQAIGRHVPLPLPVPDWSKPIIVLLLLLAIWFALRSRVSARRARRLERQREELLRDVGAMQAALVPEIPEHVAGLALSVAYRPAEGPAAGGDFYDVFSPERGKLAVILGDVAGHGHEALTQAALTRYTVRAYMQAGLEPRAALALTGRVLGDPEAERFATVVVGLYDIRAGLLTFACAGHPPPLLHGLQTREPPLICASPPIGWTAPTGRRQSRVWLPRGAVVCFFSDGLIEARCGSSEEDGAELLGRERLSELLDSLGSRPDAGRLLGRVREAARATPDDMAACVLVPQLSVVGERVHVEELEVDRVALESGQARRFLETCLVPAADIDDLLARAWELAGARATALLRAQLGSATASASVLRADAQPERAEAELHPHLAGEPTGAA